MNAKQGVYKTAHSQYSKVMQHGDSFSDVNPRLIKRRIQPYLTPPEHTPLEHLFQTHEHNLFLNCAIMQ